MTRRQRADHTIPARDVDGTHYSLAGRRELLLRLEDLPPGTPERAARYVQRRLGDACGDVLAALGLEVAG